MFSLNGGGDDYDQPVQTDRDWKTGCYNTDCPGFVPFKDSYSGIPVGTLRQEYPLLQDKDEGAQKRQPRTTGPDPRGQVPNLRGADLGL